MLVIHATHHLSRLRALTWQYLKGNGRYSLTGYRAPHYRTWYRALVPARLIIPIGVHCFLPAARVTFRNAEHHPLLYAKYMCVCENKWRKSIMRTANRMAGAKLVTSWFQVKLLNQYTPSHISVQSCTNSYLCQMAACHWTVHYKCGTRMWCINGLFGIKVPAACFLDGFIAGVLLYKVDCMRQPRSCRINLSFWIDVNLCICIAQCCGVFASQ